MLYFWVLTGEFRLASVVKAEQAGNCEFYVSGVTAGYVYHGMAGLDFHIKIAPSLRENVAKIGFSAKVDSQWADHAAEYRDRSDTYVVRLGVGEADLNAFKNKGYEGYFYLVTKDGKTYFLNNGGISYVNFFVYGTDTIYYQAAKQLNLDANSWAVVSTKAPSPFMNFDPFMCSSR